VPKWIDFGGVFNYIPEPCPQWQKSKSCRMGKNCPLSHGWLEIIYHPLLYKTKLCKSERQGGVCTKYGVYCAKAHSRCEIRSLVYIFGENWKRHYDLSNRFGFQRLDFAPKSRVIKMKKYKQYRKRVGLAVPPKGFQMLDLNRFANYLLEKQSQMPNKSRIRQERKLDRNEDAFEFKSPSDQICLPSDRHSLSSFHHEFGERNVERKNLWTPNSWLQSTDSPARTVSSIGSPVHDEYDGLCSPDTNSLMQCLKEPEQSDEQMVASGLKSEASDSSEFNYDRLPQNWFLSSCLEKATEVFTRRLL